MTSVTPLRPSELDIVAAMTEAQRLVAGRHDQGTATMNSQRARKYVAAAMNSVFPRLSWREIGRHIGGFTDLENVQALVRDAKKQGWWDDTIVEQVEGAFMARYIGERAS